MEDDDLDSLRAAALSSLLKNKSSTRTCNSNTLFHRPTVNKNLISIIPVQEHQQKSVHSEDNSNSQSADEEENEEEFVIIEGEDVDDDEEVDEIIEEVIDDGGEEDEEEIIEEVIEDDGESSDAGEESQETTTQEEIEEVQVEEEEEEEPDQDALSFASNDSFFDVISSLEEEVKTVGGKNKTVILRKSKVSTSDDVSSPKREISPVRVRDNKSPPPLLKLRGKSRGNDHSRRSSSRRRDGSSQRLARRDPSPWSSRRDVSPLRVANRREGSSPPPNSRVVYGRRDTSPLRTSRRENSPISNTRTYRRDTSPPTKRRDTSRRRDHGSPVLRDNKLRDLSSPRRNESPHTRSFRDRSSRESSPKLNINSLKSRRGASSPKSSRRDSPPKSLLSSRRGNSSKNFSREVSPKTSRTRRDPAIKSSRQVTALASTSSSRENKSFRKDTSPGRDFSLKSRHDRDHSDSQQLSPPPSSQRGKVRKRTPSPGSNTKRRRARGDFSSTKNGTDKSSGRTDSSPKTEKRLESRRAKFEQNNPIDTTTKKKIRLNVHTPDKDKRRNSDKQSGANVDDVGKSAVVINEELDSKSDNNKNSEGPEEDLRTKLTQKRATAAGRLFSTALKSTLVVPDHSKSSSTQQVVLNKSSTASGSSSSSQHNVTSVVTTTTTTTATTNSSSSNSKSSSDSKSNKLNKRKVSLIT